MWNCLGGQLGEGRRKRDDDGGVNVIQMFMHKNSIMKPTKTAKNRGRETRKRKNKLRRLI
jgi:hypothetical protein